MRSELSRIAQDIVDATSIFVRTRTINIMDTEGIIIASSDHSRIGTWHAGAAEAIKTGKTVEIKPEEVSRYAGAKQGINSPVVQDGAIVGVVGIYGVPDEVRDTAALLSVCVGLYLKQADRTERKGQRRENRRILYELLLSGGEASRINQFWSMLGKELHFPYTPILIVMADLSDRDADSFSHRLADHHLMDSRLDLVVECTDGYLLLQQKASSSIQQLVSLPGVSKVIKGRPVDSHGMAETAVREIQMLATASPNRTADMENPDDLYLLNFLPDGAPVVSQAAQRYASRLETMAGAWVPETVQAYLQDDGNQQALTKHLGIHKNTSLYRMHRIWKELGLEDARMESRMFFLRYAWYLHNAHAPA